MNKYATMTTELERQKNAQAALYTGIIAGVLLLVIWLVKFYQPIPPVPQTEEYIEINLGSSDVGSGDDQPELPGEPAPAEQIAYTPAQPVTQSADEAARDIEESNDNEAPPVHRPNVTKPDAKNINTETKTVKNTTPNNATPTPPAPKPRAVMGQTRGGNGNGGNGADTYKPGTGEGQGGGPGDQGSVGGNPNGTSYAPRRLTARTVSIPSSNFQDEFKESGKVVLDISVDENGRLLSANYQPKGSSISNRNQIEIAKRRAREIPYPKHPGGFKQDITFVFDVTN